MADGDSKFNLSKLNFFNRLDARARVFVLVGGVVAVIFLVYLGTRFFLGGRNTTGPSRVASVPAGLQSVPGGQLIPEYYQAVQQANSTTAQQAQISGSSAIPTMTNTGSQFGASCVICTEQTANVKSLLDQWSGEGKIAPDVAQSLQQLADKNVSPDEYAAMLNNLIKSGKLTPEQARLLLEQYRKQHAGVLLANSAKAMDDLIKSGQLPLDAANQLLEAQKNGVGPAAYAAQLQGLVQEGKISPATAQQLLAQYTQQRAKEITLQSIATLEQMARDGQLTPDVLKDLVNLENQMVPIDTVSTTLQKYVTAGKLVPAVATKVLDEYRAQKAAIGPSASIDQLLQNAERAAYGEINDLIRAGKMSREVGAQLAGMIQKNVSLNDYQATLQQLVQQNKITPDIAKLKLADYQLVKGLRDEAQRLAALQGNNANAASYADELKRAVQAGILTPDQATQLMQEYQAMTARPSISTAPTPGGTAQFAELQKRVQEGAITQPTVPTGEFSAAETQAQQQSDQERQSRIQALMTAMSGQAQQLVAAWQPPTMEYKAGTAETTKPGKDEEKGKAQSAQRNASSSESGFGGGVPFIKAGNILFAVLDTAVNSDYPDTPVLATVVDGKFKGAKLLGKLQTAKSADGQLDRVSLVFSVMNMDDWQRSKTINAFAIDPDTARTAIASEVNYHYFKRYGAIMAAAFVQGYSSAVTNAGTSTTGIFGTSTTHNELSPGNKIAVGIGQVGQTLGSAIQNYINIPPTVRVDSGVGLGILFMSDVS